MQMTAGQKAASKTSCYAKAQDTNTVFDPGCSARKRASAVADADAQGPWPELRVLIEAAADFCVRLCVADSPGTGKCPASIARAPGKASNADLGCSAENIVTPGGFSASEAVIQTPVDGCRQPVRGVTPATT
jgi:hypothetical protein